MDLRTLAEQYGSFYVPAFVVSVDGQALVEKLAVGVSQVEVDLTLGAAGRFSFTVVNAYDQEAHAFLSDYGEDVLEILRFGALIEVAAGYGDRSRLPVIISGLVTEITTSYAEGGTPELSVAGYDHLFPLTLGKRSQSWTQARDSDVVAEIAGSYNLATDIETTTETHAQIEQNQESDFEFIKKLAERNHYEFYVDPRRRLRFGPPRDGEDGVVTLLWGQGLLSFKPEANLAAQVTQVEVYGWDPQKKEPIVGKAVAGDESGRDASRQSGGQRVRSAVGKEAVLQVRQPVFTEAEAKRRAQAILDDRARKFVTGDAECIGLPELLPDRNVTLGNLADPFSKTYYIQQAVHRVDSGGYRTRFKVKETSL